MNAFDIAWSLLKADPAAQMVDSMGRRTGMGTIHPAIMSMLARQGREGLDEDLMSAQGPGGLETGDVSLPMESLRALRQRFGDESRFVPEVQHEDDGMGNIAEEGEGRVTPAHFKGGLETPGPEEGFLTPAQQFASDPSFAANLRRNVGGQQMGERMQATGTGNRGYKRIDETQSTGPRAQLGRMEGVVRGAKLRNRSQVVEPEAPAPKLSPEQQLQQRLQAMAESSGMDFKRTIDMPPQNTTPMEIPMEIQNKIRDLENYGMNEAAAELGVDPAELRRGMRALPGFRSGPSSRKLEYDRQASTPPEFGEGMPTEEVDPDDFFSGKNPEPRVPEMNPRYKPDWNVTATGNTRGYMEPTGPYGKVQRGIGELSSLGVGAPDSMYSQLMGMGNEMSPFTDKIVTNPDTGEKEPAVDPERQAALNAALASLGLSPSNIAETNFKARQSQAMTGKDRELEASRQQDMSTMRGQIENIRGAGKTRL